MKMVTCPSCQTEVAPCLDGSCPACRRLLPGFPTDSEDANPQPQRPVGGGDCEMSEPLCVNLCGQVEEMVQRIYQGLNRGMLPRSCCGCQAASRTLGTVEIEHEEFSLGLPIRICDRCARKPPFAPWRDPHPPIYFVALVLMTLLLVAGQFVLAISCFLAATVLILCTRPSKNWSAEAVTQHLRTHLEDIRIYRELLATVPDLTFSVTIIGDIHGCFDELQDLLQGAGLAWKT